MPERARQTWLITGASSGLGLGLARAALRAGHRVVGTARHVERAAKDCAGELSPYYARSGEAHGSGNGDDGMGGQAAEPRGDGEGEGGSAGMFSWQKLDVTGSDVGAVVRKVVEEMDVDVLVANAGVGLYGALEDMSEAEIRSQMETNFFGTTLTLHAALPHFRTLSSRRPASSRTLVVMSSISGLLVSSPAGLMYSASKFGIEAVAEGLALQLASFGVRVLLVEPGLFRTNWLRGSYKTPEGASVGGVSAAYEGTGVEEMLLKYPELHGRQEGDPWKAGERVVEAVMGTGMGKGLDTAVGERWEGVRGCLRLPLGSDAVERWEERVRMLGKNFEAVREMAMSTACEDKEGVEK